MKSTNCPSPTAWTTTLISLILDFSFLLWEFKNGILRGRPVAEREANERETLNNEITKAYEAFHKDRFIVPHNFCYLFSSKSLQQKVLQDYDSLQCWLLSYREAVETQWASTNRYAEATKKVFLPQKVLKPSTKDALDQSQECTSQEQATASALTITSEDEESSWCSQSTESPLPSMSYASDDSSCFSDVSTY